MNAYYFRHDNGYLLSAVYSHTLDRAWDLLVKQHLWCSACRANCVLEKIEKGTEYDRICAY